MDRRSLGQPRCHACPPFRPVLTPSQNANQHTAISPTKHKADSQPPGLQSLLSDTPPRSDGSDRFFGMENVVGVRSEPPVSCGLDWIQIWLTATASLFCI